MAFRSEQRFVGVGKWTDASGNELYPANVIIDDEDEVFADWHVALRRYPGREHGPDRGNRRQMEITFRKLDEVGAEDFYALLADVYASGWMSFDLEDVYPTAEHLSQAVLRAVSPPGSVALAAVADGGIVGYIALHPRTATRLRHTADLSMGVAECFRGQGVGRQLLEEALRRAREEGVLEIIYLKVRADNAAAVYLYEQAGFERLAVLNRDIKDRGLYFDGILMRLYLVPGTVGSAA